MTSQAIFQKISSMELELQKLKLEAYLQLPKQQRVNSRYSEQAVLNAVKQTRNDIWQKRYVKKS